MNTWMSTTWNNGVEWLATHIPSFSFADFKPTLETLYTGSIRIFFIYLASKVLIRMALGTNKVWDDAHPIKNALKAWSDPIIYTIVLLSIPPSFDVNIGPILTGAGFLGLVLGLLLKEFTYGIVIRFQDQYREGEHVKLNETHEGIVGKLGLRVTLLYDKDGNVEGVINNSITRWINYSRQDKSKAGSQSIKQSGWTRRPMPTDHRPLYTAGYGCRDRQQRNRRY
ncbi:mechanosensitive ion channel [Candidatus Kaiserbacteria bacterium]|nr:mechanosensitive ion channel [Candidatus Kaiserbacteria bacterium]